jgi:hypothetical protein
LGTSSSKSARAIVAWNPEAGTVTVSLESSVSGVSCRDIVQALWGPLAGGHAGIAGSPRGMAMTDEQFTTCIWAVQAAFEELGS